MRALASMRGAAPTRGAHFCKGLFEDGDPELMPRRLRKDGQIVGDAQRYVLVHHYAHPPIRPPLVQAGDVLAPTVRHLRL